MTFASGDMRRSLVIEKKNDRSRKRMRVRRLKYTCRTKIRLDVSGGDQERSSGDRQTEKDAGNSVKIVSVSFSSSLENDRVLSSSGDETRDGSERSSYGVVSVAGRRREMEDAVRAEVGFAVDGKYDFFGVYDGHGGADVARVCRERFHEVVAEAVEMEVVKGVKEEVDWERVMEGCFRKMDEEVNGISVAKTVGSTAVAAVVTEEQVVVANCGDCRAVLSRSSGTIALALSSDHKPDRADELERIEAAGGRVINWNGSRVLGVLSTSRSVGDQYLRPYVISKPDVTVTKRTEEDEFLILASDGLWDVISNEVACQVVKKVLQGRIMTRRIINHDRDHVLLNYERPPDSATSSRISEAAAVLAELAMARGSKDNISVIVVDLRKLPD
ncbi:probable protein phosphatase 2C 8 [Rosa rugosa]|uniref:probable protein phosphatase 2C 8 n=1 Tax=Rosa rugosa TaxID=74645 RepID=UPI002B410BEF|nr:probable protein phosphatase 2C 8 [Rosa rugosa]XP_061998411.1 probable protein phosphatase 2C 8 [Rosa rugosa]